MLCVLEKRKDKGAESGDEVGEVSKAGSPGTVRTCCGCRDGPTDTLSAKSVQQVSTCPTTFTRCKKWYIALFVSANA